MTIQDFWPPFLAALLGSSAVLGIFSGIINRYIDRVFKNRDKTEDERRAKDFATFDTRLKTELATFTARNSLLCEKQAEAMGELYSQLWGVSDGLRTLANFRKIETPKEAELFQRAKEISGKQVTRLRHYYLPRRIFFKKDICDIVQLLINRLESQRTKHIRSVSMEPKGQDYADHIKEIYALEDEITDFMKMLESKFRSLLKGEE